MSTAVIIGRFTPLHNGHVAMIQKATQEHDKVLILVGSPNKLPDFKLPFPVETRAAAVKAMFPDAVVKSIPDVPSDMEWVADVSSRMLTMEEDPMQITMYCGDKDQKFYRENFLSPVVALDSSGVSATMVRELMYHGNWEDAYDLVPKVTEELLKSWTLTDAFLTLKDEYFACVSKKKTDFRNHAFSNPVEPVAHAVVIKDSKVLVGLRNGSRGKGQWALPGGYMNHDETSRAAALRELKEETGLDLLACHRAAEVAFAVEENLNDLSTRTVGLNYMYLLEDDVELTAGDDFDEVKWVPLKDILEDKELLFYNHNLVVKRLVAHYHKAN